MKQLLKYSLSAVIGTALGAWIGGAALAQNAKPLKIGVLTDLSSPATDVTGVSTIEAVKLAVEDSGGKVGGRPIEVISADYQNKADIGAVIARGWIDKDGVDVIVDVANSAVAVAVSKVAEEKNKPFLAIGPASTVLTNSDCSPNMVQWVHDSYAAANIVAPLVDTGAKTWFFITADYTFGHDLQKFATDAIEARGGKVIGSALHPLGAPDFASFLLQAQASGADAIGIASAFDGVNIMKQAAEFGLTKNPKQKVAMLLTTVAEIHGVGLNVAQGLLISTPWYWNQDDDARAFTKRLQEHTGGRIVTQHHAGAYSAVVHYLKAIKALGGNATDGAAIIAKMKEIPTDDPLYKKGYIRADGRKIHPLYIYRVKKPAESKSKYDLLEYDSTVPAEQAFQPIEKGSCKFAKK